MTDSTHIPLPSRKTLSKQEMIASSKRFLDEVSTRRTVRDYSTDPVPREVIGNCIQAAGLAPSGANQQPWHFAIVESAEVKSKIRIAAEEEERTFYDRRATQEWLEVLAPLGTDANKPFLEIAPYLIAIFSKPHSFDTDGNLVKHYYPNESIGIATGVLITALHQAGLATLTHTPSPMKFLNQILERPKNERPFLLLVVGKPAAGATVPSITKKRLDEISSVH